MIARNDPGVSLGEQRPQSREFSIEEPFKEEVMKSLRVLAVALGVVALLAGGFACKKDAATEGAAAVKEIKVPETPDLVVKQGLDALKNKKPVEVYALLPASYRADIQSVVTAVTSKMDKEIFEMGVKILETAASALEKHGEQLAPMMAGMPVAFDEVKKNVLDAVKLLKEVGLLDYATMSKLDVAGFLAANGGKLMGTGMDAFQKFNKADYDEMFGMMDKVEIKLLESAGDKGKLEMKVGEEVETVEFVKVDGAWVPAEMAANWAEGIAEAKAEVEKGMKEFEANKAQAKAMLQMVLSTVEEFEKSGDMAKLQGLMGGLM